MSLRIFACLLLIVSCLLYVAIVEWNGGNYWLKRQIISYYHGSKYRSIESYELYPQVNKSRCLYNAFRQSILVLNFNFGQHYANIPVLQELYGGVFGKVVTCGPRPSAFSNNFKPDIEFDVNDGHFSYHCLALAIQKYGTEYEGYFYGQDDMIINWWTMVNMERTKIWQGVKHVEFTQSPDTDASKSWIWWHTRMGLYACTEYYSELQSRASEENDQTTKRKAKKGHKGNTLQAKKVRSNERSTNKNTAHTAVGNHNNRLLDDLEDETTTEKQSRKEVAQAKPAYSLYEDRTISLQKKIKQKNSLRTRPNLLGRKKARHSIGKTARTLLNTYLKNGNGKPKCGKGWSDFFYIPGRLLSSYVLLSDIAYQKKLYLEIAVNNILRSLDDADNFIVLDGLFLPDVNAPVHQPKHPFRFTIDDTFWRYYHLCLSTIHPFKISQNKIGQVERLKSVVIKYKEKITNC